MDCKQIRWGVIGAGNIAHDFATALRTLPITEHRLTAVASRSLSKAQSFASLHKISKAYGSYLEIAEDEEVDIVYVATVNNTHKSVVMMALDHDKHVLCEKPLAVNAREAEDLMRFAKAKQLFLMEGIWSYFLPSWNELSSQIKSFEIGKPRFINIMHARTFYAKRPRFYSRDIAGGMLSSLGQYPLALANMVFGGKEPDKIVATGYNFSTGVDKSHSVSLSFKTGEILNFFLSCDFDHLENAEIVGEKGKIEMNAPHWCPTRLITPTAELEFEMPEADMPLKFTNSTGLSFEARHVRQCLLNDWLESNIVSHETTLRITRWTDEIRRQLGVVYDQDEHISR